MFANISVFIPNLLKYCTRVLFNSPSTSSYTFGADKVSMSTNLLAAALSIVLTSWLITSTNS
jgi:hypothetical protein